MKKKNKKSVLVSNKPFREPNVLGPTDKVNSMGQILGAPEKYPTPLNKKFVGCSKDSSTSNEILREDELNYNEFTNASKAVDKKCPVCGISFKNIHSKSQKFCSRECDSKGRILQKLEEAWNNQTKKAGFIPYFKDNNGIIRMMFVMSSDSAYGGSRFQLAKGHIDKGESGLVAALREANEECGLKQSNLILSTVKVGWKGEIHGNIEKSEMVIYIGEVNDPIDFDKPGYEVSKTKWMTSDEFFAYGRKSQINIVKFCAGRIQ